MSQSKKQSFIEACTNTGIGFVIAVIGTFFIVWALDIKSSPSKNITMTLFFTVLSIVRGYVIRRWFNKRSSKITNRTQSKYIVGDPIIVHGNLGTVVDRVEWDSKLNEYHYFFKDEQGETWFANQSEIMFGQ